MCTPGSHGGRKVLLPTPCRPTAQIGLVFRVKIRLGLGLISGLGLGLIFAIGLGLISGLGLGLD